MSDLHILGVSAYYHDSAACLVRNGEIVAAAQEERFSRVKHDHRFPAAAVEYCLGEAGVSPDELDAVAFYDKPWLKFERILETYLNYAPRGLSSFMKAMPLWLKEKLWIGDSIRNRMGYDGELYFPEHHQSHAASAFYPSPFHSAAILTVDGVGEWATAAWGFGEGERITLERELRFPHSLGLLYSAFTYYTGFRVNSGEYKVMGLAPYGEPRYRDLILDEVLDLRPDGSFRLDMAYFNYCQGLTMTSPAFHRLFGGPPREPESDITQRDMDLARSVQDVTEEVMLRMARHVQKETGARHLCLAGGVALNCVANGKILREEIFDDVWIQPAAGDAGGALGAALFVWHQVMGRRRAANGRRSGQHGSLLGPGFSSNQIAPWLDRQRHPYHRHDVERIPDLVSGYLEKGKVVGWFSGRMEFGPRALGGRSILGDARDAGMQSAINRKIKFRESFRPLAPSCLEEDVGAYFDLDRPSPYMLVVAPVREARRRPAPEAPEAGVDRVKQVRSDVPAVTHVDYSARIQTVGAEANPLYRRLLEAFKERTGEGILVNTSFNVRGEPIVCTPEDAYACFMNTGMDVLVLENLVLLKDEQPREVSTRVPSARGGNGGPSWRRWIETPAHLTESEDRRGQLREFGVVMAAACALIGGVLLWRGSGLGRYVSAVALPFAGAALLRPGLLGPVQRIWMMLADLLGTMVTWIILTLTYFVVMTPVGVALRTFKGETLGKRPDPAATSYWIRVEDDGPSSRPDKPF